jgi:hypothetical protein
VAAPSLRSIRSLQAFDSHQIPARSLRVAAYGPKIEASSVWSARTLGSIGAVNMSEKEKPAKTNDQFLRDAFEGMKGVS